MNRRRFLGGMAGVALLAPFAARAQPPEKPYRVGTLEGTTIAVNAANVDGFRQGMRDLGYVEREAYVIEYRSVDGRDERLPALAAELVGLNVDMILPRGTPAALAAKPLRRQGGVAQVEETGDPGGGRNQLPEQLTRRRAGRAHPGRSGRAARAGTAWRGA